MKIEHDVKLDFSSVLIRPQRSTLTSRSDVSVERSFTFKYSKQHWHGVPIIAANMDTVGTLEMYDALRDHKMVTALHKHYDEATLIQHFSLNCDPAVALCHDLNEYTLKHGHLVDPLQVFRDSPQAYSSFYSMGISDTDYDKFKRVMAGVSTQTGLDQVLDIDAMEYHPVAMVCVDVANGYTERFVEFIKKLRNDFPHITIMAGNVVTAEMTTELIYAGADIVKCGIGGGSACTTRKMAGVGYPQLSAVIECAEAAHMAGGLLCSDGGCTVPGDIAKAFGAGADFVMLGGMLAAHEESGGDLILKTTITNELDPETGLPQVNTQQYKRFYGMSSDTAMNKHNGGVASYRASEGKTVDLAYRGHVNGTILSILGGLRSSCTYVGASKLKDMSKCTTFVRVTQQLNDVFGKS